MCTYMHCEAITIQPALVIMMMTMIMTAFGKPIQSNFSNNEATM